MKRILAAAVGLMVGASGALQALTIDDFGFGGCAYWDLDGFGMRSGIPLGQRVTTSTPLTADWNIADGDGDAWDHSGFGLGEDITSAKFAFLIVDDSLWDGAERYTIELDGESLVDDTWRTFQFGALSGEFIANYLEADGTVEYTVRATSGDFRVIGAGLAVTTCPATSVPDGGTSCALLGLGLCALAAVGRRFRA